MTYKLESFIEKISSPVVCVFGSHTVEYVNGKFLSSQIFDRFWLVEEIMSQNGRIVLKMKENDKIKNLESFESFF